MCGIDLLSPPWATASTLCGRQRLRNIAHRSIAQNKHVVVHRNKHAFSSLAGEISSQISKGEIIKTFHGFWRRLNCTGPKFSPLLTRLRQINSTLSYESVESDICRYKSCTTVTAFNYYFLKILYEYLFQPTKNSIQNIDPHNCDLWPISLPSC